MTRIAQLRRAGPLVIVGLVMAVVLACVIYARLGDSYVATAITTAPASEAKSFDLASLSGLAALGSGGQRTNFEEFAFRINSDANIRAVLSMRRQSQAVFEFTKVGRVERTLLALEQGARALFGKDPKIVDSDDRLSAIVQHHLEVKKTPEGYYAIRLTGERPDGKLALLSALIDNADKTARQRAIVDYKGKIATYQALVDEEQRPAQRAILVSLIAREYTTFASAQSGQVFAFDYVDAPRRVVKVYAPGFFTILLAMVAGWLGVCLAYLIVRNSLLKL